MSERPFSEIIRHAAAGDNYAAEMIIEAYMPLVLKYSYVDGVFDEDCRQFLLLRMLIAIRKFKT